MSIAYNLISVLDLFALVQGLLLGVILVKRNQANRPSLYLGLFLITYSLELSRSILDDTTIMEQVPRLLFIPINFYYLNAAFLYLYAKRLTGSKLSKKKRIYILGPGILEFSFFLALFIVPSTKKLAINSMPIFEVIFDVYFLIGGIWSAYLAYKTIQLISKYQNHVFDYYSNTENRTVKWVKLVAMVIIGFNILLMFYIFVELPSKFDELLYGFVSCLNVGFIFWVGIMGLIQSTIIPNKAKFTDTNVVDLEKVKLNKSIKKPTKQEPDNQFEKIKRVLLEEQLYKNKDLNLPSLAKHFLLSRRELSNLINSNADMNFNRFINEYRVEEAKKLLTDPAFRHLNMLGIADEVGFSSKATFYAVFKKRVKISPGQFKKANY